MVVTYVPSPINSVTHDGLFVWMLYSDGSCFRMLLRDKRNAILVGHIATTNHKCFKSDEVLMDTKIVITPTFLGPQMR